MAKAKKNGGKHKLTAEEKQAHKEKPGTGYCRPPKETQIKPGEVRSPGRPKNSLNYDTLVERHLDMKIEVIVDGERKRISKLEAAIIKRVNDGLTKGGKSLDRLLDEGRRIYGCDNPERGDDLTPDDEELIELFLIRKARKAEGKP